MANRQEEKEARRAERLAQEQAEQRAAARKKRLQLVTGGVLALALIAAGVFLLAGLGGDDEKSAGDGPKQADTNTKIKLPDPINTNLEEAAKAAGCELINPKYEGAGHEEKAFKPADYKSNPPTSGTHFPTWYDDGIYEPGDSPDLGQLVHTLEHGRINVQYKPGTPADTVAQLEAFIAENGGYHMLLHQNETDMKYEVAATAWTHIVGCPTFKPEVFDALRTFRDKYLDKGPEQVP